MSDFYRAKMYLLVKRQHWVAQRILSVTHKVLCGGVLLFASWYAHADVPGSSDYAYERFPGSQIVDYRREDNTVYNLALGRMQRAAGRVAPSQSERFQGDLRRITYEIPDGFNAPEVFEHFRAQLLSDGQQELFNCQGRGCGSSNFWANDVFGNRILYGPETGQYYMAASYLGEQAGREVSGYVALYVVTRANRRLYAHLDFLELSEQVAAERRAASVPDARTLLQRLSQDGMVTVPALVFDEQDELTEDQGLSLLIEALTASAQTRVYIVGHLQAESSLDEQIARSLARATLIQERLIAAGIDADRLEAHGVGPLAPFCRPGPCRQRIEVLVRP
jgi:hypothetical protein